MRWLVDHSESELRFLSLGCSSRGRILVVAYTEREGRIRLITAREAAAKERRKYESEQSGY
ncbi:MAG: BrnT family toxin [Bryobacteraceae bacterium]|nr:BrnT family toxin [Bryobacteraceae bacterium]